MVARAVRGGLRDCYTMTAVKSLNRMSRVRDSKKQKHLVSDMLARCFCVERRKVYGK